jgi:hydroxymethylbilane synthase
VVARCGLELLGHAALATEILPATVILPAVGQGALAIECRADDDRVQYLLAALHDAPTAACVGAERAMLAALDGSCRTPIAGFAEIDGDRISLDALLLTPDGNAEHRARGTAEIADAIALGTRVGGELRKDAGPAFGFE